MWIVRGGKLHLLEKRANIGWNQRPKIGIDVERAVAATRLAKRYVNVCGKRRLCTHDRGWFQRKPEIAPLLLLKYNYASQRSLTSSLQLLDA